VCPKALQDVNPKLWKEWLPGIPYFEFPGYANIEFMVELKYRGQA